MATPVSKKSASNESVAKNNTPKAPAKSKKSLIDTSRIDAPNLESTPTLANASKARFSMAGARCVQCGKTIRAVPFALNNIVCRACDGADRGRRVAALLLPDKSAEVLVADVTTDAIPDDTTS
jgi:hypothetical protein